MITPKKMWIKSWTNCHVAEISMERHEESCEICYRAYNKDLNSTGHAGYLSISRMPIYRQISIDVCSDFCNACGRCDEIETIGRMI